MNSEKKLKIAIQKQGRLSEPSKKFLASLGLGFEANDEKLSVICQNYPLNIINMRDNDIPNYVSQSIVDFGIVGLNVLLESREKVRVTTNLDFCKCRLVIAAPADSLIKTLQDLEGKRIATSYPNTLNDFLKKNQISAKVVVVQGSVELAPYLQAADAVCDITESGRTLKEFDLIPIKTILESQAVLISPLNKSQEQKEFMERFLNKVI